MPKTDNTLDKSIDEIFDWKFFDKNYSLTKQFYDIKTFDGDVRENCWPNAGDFHDGSARDYISEKEVEFIRPSVKEKAKSLLQTTTKKAEVRGRIDEVKLMPHQYDPKLEMHEMTDEEIPQPKVCKCYKGRRLEKLEAELQAQLGESE